MLTPISWKGAARTKSSYLAVYDFSATYIIKIPPSGYLTKQVKKSAFNSNEEIDTMRSYLSNKGVMYWKRINNNIMNTKVSLSVYRFLTNSSMWNGIQPRLRTYRFGNHYLIFKLVLLLADLYENKRNKVNINSL